MLPLLILYYFSCYMALVFLETNEVLEEGIIPSAFSHLCFMALFLKGCFSSGYINRLQYILSTVVSVFKVLYLVYSLG